MPSCLAARLARRLPAGCTALCLDCGDRLADEATVPAPGAPGYHLHADCAGARP
jgi:hypothetical protein